MFTTSTAPLTLKQRGYHMSEQDEKRIKADALWAYNEAKTRFNICKANAEELAREMSGNAKMLTHDFQGINLIEAKHNWIAFEDFEKMVEDIQRAAREKDEAETKARSLGAL